MRASLDVLTGVLLKTLKHSAMVKITDGYHSRIQHTCNQDKVTRTKEPGPRTTRKDQDPGPRITQRNQDPGPHRGTRTQDPGPHRGTGP